MRNVFTLLLVSITLFTRAQDGSLDISYGNSGKQVVNGASVLNEQQRIVILSDKKILHCYTHDNGGNRNFGMVRYHEDGAVDVTFGVNGYVSTDFGGDDHAYAITVTSTGQIILVGSSGGSFAIARYTSNGTLDATFDGDGRKLQAIGTDAIAYAVVESGGFITVAGTAVMGTRNDFALARFTNSGALDVTFDGNSGSGNGIVTTAVTNTNGAVDIIYSMVLQTNGKIVVAGQAFNSNTAFSQFGLARYNTDGVLDTGFDGDGIVTTVIGSYDIAYGVAVQSSGRIVAAGSSYNGSDFDFAVAVYTSAGALDAAFDGDGKETLSIGSSDDVAYDVAIQSNGKILVAGSTVATTSPVIRNDFVITRFNADGTVDNSTFGETSPGLTTIDFTGASDDFGYDIDLGADYIMFGGVSGSGLASARLIYSSSALPVHLISFTAYKLSKSVTLKWQSARERDVESFEIERSSDGIHFSKIGSLAAAGNSSSIKGYSFEDKAPGSVNFYRLKTVNFSSSPEYSRIVIVRFEGNTSMQAFPNPVKASLNLQITQPRGILNLQLFDISGRLVKAYQLQSNGTTLSTYIDVSDIKKGIYLLRVNSEVIKIIKE